MKTQLAIVATVASIWATSAPAYAGGAAPVVEWDASGHFKPVKLAAFPDYALECESDPRHHIVLSIKPAEKHWNPSTRPALKNWPLEEAPVREFWLILLATSRIQLDGGCLFTA